MVENSKDTITHSKNKKSNIQKSATTSARTSTRTRKSNNKQRTKIAAKGSPSPTPSSSSASSKKKRTTKTNGIFDRLNEAETFSSRDRRKKNVEEHSTYSSSAYSSAYSSSHGQNSRSSSSSGTSTGTGQRSRKSTTSSSASKSSTVSKKGSSTSSKKNTRIYPHDHNADTSDVSTKKSKGTGKKKGKKVSKKPTIFDRLSRAETFASADKKGKISRSKNDQTTRNVSSSRQRPVYAPYKTPVTHASIEDQNGWIQPYGKNQNRKEKDYDNGNGNDIDIVNGDGNIESIHTTQLHVTEEQTSMLSPERNAIADLRLRIQNSLSGSDQSQSSIPTPTVDNIGTHSFDINHRIDEEEEEDTLFNLIWERDFDAADVYLNDHSMTSQQIRRALCYQNEDGWNALMRAFYRRPPHYDSAPDSLIRQMVEVGGKDLVTMTNIWGENSLSYALKNKRSLYVIRMLLNAGGGKELVMHKNFRGKSSLHVACEQNASLDVVESLVELGGRELIMMEDDIGVVARSKSVEVMNYLEKISGDLRNKRHVSKRPSVLHDLIVDKMFDDAKRYLDDENIMLSGKRSAMAHRDKHGFTPLMLSILKNAPDSIVEKIIIIGGLEIVSLTNRWETIALFYALAHKRSLNIISLLVEKGGGEKCIAKCYEKGLTPLHWACKYNSPLEIIQYLIEEGGKFFFNGGKQALVSMLCFYKQNPLHVACANGPSASLEIVNQVLDAASTNSEDEASPLHASDKSAQLPLHVACQKNASFSIIKCLVDHDHKQKQSLSQKDASGKVPLHLACENNATLETITFLADVGGRETVNQVPSLLRGTVHMGILASYL